MDRLPHPHDPQGDLVGVRPSSPHGSGARTRPGASLVRATSRAVRVPRRLANRRRVRPWRIAAGERDEDRVQRRDWIRLTGSIGFVNVVTIAVGLGFQAGVARFFGATSTMDAYVVALGLPDLVGSVFLLATFPPLTAPLFADVRHRSGEAEAWRMRSEERRVGKECRSRWSPDH